MINRSRGFSSVKSENWLIGELENLLIIWSRAFTPVMSYEPEGSTPVKIFRCLPRLDSTPRRKPCFIYSSTSHTLKANIVQRGKHLTGFRHLPKPVANELGLGIFYF